MSVNVIVPVSEIPAVYVAKVGSEAFVHVPVPPDQVPVVAEPPILPPIAAEVAPAQIAVKAAPAVAVGAKFTVTVTACRVREGHPAITGV